MTSYPVDFYYDSKPTAPGGGGSFLGLAETAADAIRVARDGGYETDDFRVTGATLTDQEVGPISETPSELEAAWAAEIAAGWIEIARCGRAYRAIAWTWTIDGDAI